MSAFAATTLKASDPRYAFDGASATIIKRSERVDQARGSLIAYSMTIVATNQSGEYFWYFFRTDSSPVIRHLGEAKARLLTGDARPTLSGL